ncbi:MAG TPA: hypothetical protein VL490_08735 [Mucilaginibacter sp.]|jgi:hypothetical protein|nr:hypothetical protein [Mucilaginibacter sp.]
MTKYSDITFTVFYTLPEWRNIITYAIKPFLQTEQLEGNLACYYVYLYPEPTQHITIVLYPSRDHYTLENKFVEQIGNFLSKNQSPTDIQHQLDNNLMNYSNNSIGIDIEKPIRIAISDDKLQHTRHCISQVLISVLEKNEAEIETIYTVLIYLQLGIIKAINPTIKKARTKAVELLSYVESVDSTTKETVGKQVYDDIKLWFENDMDSFTEIIEDIWNTDEYNDDLKWLETWIVHCKQFIKDNDFNESFMILSKLINKHIGFNYKIFPKKLLLNSFIQSAKNTVLRIS